MSICEEKNNKLDFYTMIAAKPGSCVISKTKFSNKSVYIIILLFVFLAPISGLYAENADSLYKKGKFDEAEKIYEKLDLDNPKDLRYRYNKGCASFQKADYKSAEAAFSSTIRRTNDKQILFRSAYNLGNTAFSQNDFSAAAEFYKQAIIYNPDSNDARYNLELSLKKLDEQKKNDKNGDKNKDNKKDKSNNNKDSEKNQKKDDKNKNENKQDKPGNEDKSKKKAKVEPMNLEKQKAEALLDNVKENPSKIMELQMKDQKKQAGSGKNW